MKDCNKKTVEMADTIEELATLICGYGFYAYHGKDYKHPIPKEAVQVILEMGAYFIMKNSIEREVKVDAGGYPYIDATELYDYENDKPLAKAGDNIKVVFIKDK